MEAVAIRTQIDVILFENKATQREGQRKNMERLISTGASLDQTHLTRFLNIFQLYVPITSALCLSQVRFLSLQPEESCLTQDP